MWNIHLFATRKNIKLSNQVRPQKHIHVFTANKMCSNSLKCGNYLKYSCSFCPWYLLYLMLKSMRNLCNGILCRHLIIDCTWREVFVQRLYGIVSPWPPVPTVLKHYTKTKNSLALFPPTLPPTPILSLFFIILLHMFFFYVYLYKVYVAISVITENLGRCRCLHLKMSLWQFADPSHIHM